MGKLSNPQFSLLISIPKKAVRLATHRNRLKRLIREAFRENKEVRGGNVYYFRVRVEPRDHKLKLTDVRMVVSKLLEEYV